MRRRFGWSVDFVLGGQGKGKRTRQGKYYRVVFAGDSRVQTAPFFLCYILYIEQWWFSLQHTKGHCERSPILDALGSMICSSWDSSTTLSTH